MEDEPQARQVPQEIQDHLTIWVKFNRRWRKIHYILGVTATFCAITVATQPSLFQKIPHLLGILAWMSAVCVASMTFLIPLRRARGHVSATRILTDAYNRYRHDEKYEMKELLDTLKEGEDLISRGEEL